MPKPLPVAAEAFADPDKDEQRTVHEVYDAIAPHFARTRFKPWPLIDKFLRSQTPGSIGLDSGAGNGKYIPVAQAAQCEMIALDRSGGLLELAKKSENEGGVGAECVRGDLTEKCWRLGMFDFAISIAAIHHLSTPERRRRAVQALLHPLRLSSTAPYSRFMIYVWAYEQGPDSRRKMGSLGTVVASGSGSGAGNAGLVREHAARSLGFVTDGGVGTGETAEIHRIQDVLVPWVLTTKPGPSSKAGKQEKNKAEVTGTTSDESAGSGEVFHRYYHLFVQGELGELVRLAAVEEGFVVVEEVPSGGQSKREPWLRVLREGWEADNWWLEGEVGLLG